MQKIALAAMVLGLLAACSNGFAKYYRPTSAATLAALAPQLAAAPPEPAVYTHSADMQADGKRLMEDGYVFIGESSFYGPANRSNQQQAVAQGKKVGAAVVLFKSEYMDTRSGVVPYTVAKPPVVSTVNTSGMVYGSNGASATYNGTGTVTTPGGVSTYAIPYSVDRNTFYASYWAKRDPAKIHLGAMYCPLERHAAAKVGAQHGGPSHHHCSRHPRISGEYLGGRHIAKVERQGHCRPAKPDL